MPKPIIWSPLSESDIEKIVEYLHEIWSVKVLSNLLDEVDLLLNPIAIHPKQFPVVNKKLKVCKCVVTKHNTVFYREKKDCIELLRIFDTRQNPKKLKLK